MGLIGSDFAALLTDAAIKYGSATPEDLTDIANEARLVRSVRAMVRHGEKLIAGSNPDLAPAVRGQIQTALQEIRYAIGCREISLAAQRAEVLGLILETFSLPLPAPRRGAAYRAHRGERP